MQEGEYCHFASLLEIGGRDLNLILLLLYGPFQGSTAIWNLQCPQLICSPESPEREGVLTLCPQASLQSSPYTSCSLGAKEHCI